MSTEQAKAERLARWLAGDPTVDPAELDADVREAVYALRPELAPKLQLSADDVLQGFSFGAVPTGAPVGAPEAQASEEGAEIVPFPARPAPMSPPELAEDDDYPRRRSLRRRPSPWLVGFGGMGGLGLGLAAAAALLLAITTVLPSRQDAPGVAAPAEEPAAVPEKQGRAGEMPLELVPPTQPSPDGAAAATPAGAPVDGLAENQNALRDRESADLGTVARDPAAKGALDEGGASTGLVGERDARGDFGGDAGGAVGGASPVGGVSAGYGGGGAAARGESTTAAPVIAEAEDWVDAPAEPVVAAAPAQSPAKPQVSAGPELAESARRDNDDGDALQKVVAKDEKKKAAEGRNTRSEPAKEEAPAAPPPPPAAVTTESKADAAPAPAAVERPALGDPGLGWRNGLDATALAKFDGAMATARAKRVVGDYAGAADTLGAAVGAPARGGMYLAALAAGDWLVAGNPKAAASVAQRGLLLSGDKSAERSWLLVRYGDALKASGDLAGAQAAWAEASR